MHYALFYVAITATVFFMPTASPRADTLALTDAEIEAQIERARERGRAMRRETESKQKAAEQFQPSAMQPRIQTHNGFTAYHFTGELAEHQVYKVAVQRGAIWIGTSNGLLRYEPAREHWTLIAAPVDSGARGVPRVVAADGRLAVSLWAYPKRGHATPKGAWWYEIDTGRWIPIGSDPYMEPLYWDGAQLWLRRDHRLFRLNPINGMQQIYSERDEPALKTVRVSAMTIYGHEAWICAYGTWDKAQKKLVGGGVLRLHLQSQSWRVFTKKDGLGDEYCASIDVDDRYVWISHWEHNKGVSRFHRADYRWEALPQAVNQTPIGGPLLLVDRDRIWIGQQKGIAWLETRTQDGFHYSETLGLPGYITSGLVRDEEAVWAAMYAYGGKGFHGVRSSGLVRLKRAPPPSP